MRASTKKPQRWGALALLCLSAAAGATPLWPDADAISAARKAHPFPQIYPLPAGNLPRIPPGPASGTSENPTAQPTPPTDGRHPPDLLVFISLAMPRASLERLVLQATQSGAVLVLRGLHRQSMRETLRAIADLRGAHKLRIELDPEAFTRYSVASTPSFVLPLGTAASQCSTAQAPPASFLLLAGDVSLDYVLQTMRRLRPNAAPAISPWLARLGAR